MSHPVVEQSFKEFSEVGRMAVVIELKLRLLANKIPEVEKSALANKISETESILLPYLLENNLISEAEKKQLEQSRKIRNKIFHCEFETAVKLIDELREKPLSSGFVTGARISELEGENLLEKILGFAEAVQSRRPAKGIFKVDQTTTKEAGIFGWLIDACCRGVFTEGQKIIQDSIDVLDRVFENIAREDYQKGKTHE